LEGNNWGDIVRCQLLHNYIKYYINVTQYIVGVELVFKIVKKP
jgi:hypothetical protein